MRNSKESLSSLKAGAGRSDQPGRKSKVRSSKKPTGSVTSSFEMGQGTSGVGSRKSSTGKGSGSHK
jgi:hypothetical protein